MEDLPYRKGANAFVIDENNNFLLIQKNGYDTHQWDAPGGGIEQNEDPDKGLLRELKEELSTDSFEIIKRSPFVHRFEWPEEAQLKKLETHGTRWRGQEKLQYIVRFTGNKDEIHLQKEELKDMKWVHYEELKDHLVFEGQWENAKNVIEEADLDK